MPSRSKLRETIEHSDPTNWEQFEHPLTWVLWDEELTIADIGDAGSGEPTDINRPEFLNKSQTDRHQKTTIRITFRGTPLDQFPVLRLDDGRVRMIKPSIDQSTGDAFLNRYEAHLSQIMSAAEFSDLVDSVLDLRITAE